MLNNSNIEQQQQSWVLIKYGRMLTFMSAMNHTQSHDGFDIRKSMG